MDALQNARGKPLATVYSARAYPHAPVSTPVKPDGIEETDFSPEQWSVKTMDKRLKAVGNLWEDFWSKRQTLSEALELLDRKLVDRKI